MLFSKSSCAIWDQFRFCCHIQSIGYVVLIISMWCVWGVVVQVVIVIFINGGFHVVVVVVVVVDVVIVFVIVS